MASVGKSNLFDSILFGGKKAVAHFQTGHKAVVASTEDERVPKRKDFGDQVVASRDLAAPRGRQRSEPNTAVYKATPPSIDRRLSDANGESKAQDGPHPSIDPAHLPRRFRDTAPRF